MEVDEGSKKPVVYDSDLDNENPDKENEADNKDDDKKKINRKPVVKFDANYIIDKDEGLKKLYRYFVLENEKNIHLKGKGHEVGDLNRVMKVYKNWHYQAFPKLEYTYFIERLHRIGNDKATKAFMNKLRKVYVGEEIMEEFLQQPANVNQQNIKEDAKNMFEYINTSTNAAPFDDYSSFCQSNNNVKQPMFKLHEPPQMPEARQSNNFNFQANHHVVKEMNELTPEQLRMIEENRQKALERKRKREELSNIEVHEVQSEGQSKKLQSDANSNIQVNMVADEITKKNIGFEIQYADDEVVELNEEDIQDYIDGIEYLGSQIDTQFNKMMREDENGQYEYD